MSIADRRWGVVLPVKRLGAAKSRLSTRPAGQRRALALAFALDVVAACAATEPAALVVVTDDEEVSAAASDLGAAVLDDEPRRGLVPAFLFGAAHVQRSVPGADLALLVADLPALRPEDLTIALRSAARHERAFVSDVAGTGTTLLTAQAGVAPDPHFGRRSRAAHARSGAVELHDPELVRLRCDVDTEVDLWHATTLGVGLHTAAALAGSASPAGEVRGVDRQATVRSYDDATRSGTVLFDDGSIVGFGTAAYDVGGLRLLRPGQRVRVRVVDGTAGPEITALTLATFPFPDEA